MKFLLIVLIAAVTVNCLATTIKGKDVGNTVAVPYIDMLLPPHEDEQENRSINNAPSKIRPITESPFVYKTTTKSTKITPTTTKKPATKSVNKILPEPSIQALLPPLLEATIGKDGTIKAATTTIEPTFARTTTSRPIITTNKSVTATTKPQTTTFRAMKPNLKVPDLQLEPLQLPLFDNASGDAKDKKLTPTTTQKPMTAQKFNKNKYVSVKAAGSRNESKPSLNAKDDFGTKSHQQNSKSQSETERQKSSKEKANNLKFVDKQFNYSFDLYLGSTTQKPVKRGLPTITPFPNRLG